MNNDYVKIGLGVAASVTGAVFINAGNSTVNANIVSAPAIALLFGGLFYLGWTARGFEMED